MATQSNSEENMKAQPNQVDNLSVQSFVHKHRKLVTDRFVITLIDKRDEKPRFPVTVELSGTFRETASMSVKDARDLEKALHAILRGVKVIDLVTPDKEPK